MPLDFDAKAFMRAHTTRGNRIISSAQRAEELKGLERARGYNPVYDDVTAYAGRHVRAEPRFAETVSSNNLAFEKGVALLCLDGAPHVDLGPTGCVLGNTDETESLDSSALLEREMRGDYF
jgi:hypothetical protein